MKAVLSCAFLVLVCQGRYFIDEFDNYQASSGTYDRRDTINAYPIDSCSLFQLGGIRRWVKYTCNAGHDRITRQLYTEDTCTITAAGGTSIFIPRRPDYNAAQGFTVRPFGTIPLYDCSGADDWFSVGIWSGTNGNQCSAGAIATYYEFKMAANICFPNSYNALNSGNGEQRDREDNGNWVMGSYSGCSPLTANPMGVAAGTATVNFYSDNACTVQAQTAMTVGTCVKPTTFAWKHPVTKVDSPYFNLEVWQGQRAAGGSPDPNSDLYWLQFGRCGRGDNPVIPAQAPTIAYLPDRNPYSEPIDNVKQNEAYPELAKASTKIIFVAFVVTILSMLNL